MPNHEFKLIPSKPYIFLLFTVILASVVVTLLLNIPLWLKSLLMALLLAYGVSLLRRHALLTAKDAVIGLKKLDNTNWQITTRGGVYEGSLLGESAVTKLVSILRFAIKGRRLPLSCIVWCNSLRGDEYRQLVVLLRNG